MKVSAAGACGVRNGSRERLGGNMRVPAAKERAKSVSRNRWHTHTEGVGVQPLETRPSCPPLRHTGAKLLESDLVLRHFNGAQAPVFEVDPGRGAHPADKIIVRVQTTFGQLEERSSAVRFCVRSEDASGSLGRTSGERTTVVQGDVSAAPGKLEGDRAPDDPGTDHHDPFSSDHDPIISNGGMPLDLRADEDRMARARRKTAPGCIHHVVNRGNRRKAIFQKRADYQAFLDVLGEAVAKFGMRVIAFCIMRNHWHLVLWPDEAASISAFMHWLTSTHVRRYHAHYQLTGTGHLYQARYRNDVCREPRDVLAVIRYVEGNPLAAGIVTRAQDWAWSSLRLRVLGEEQGLLVPGPVELPSNWTTYVNENTPKRLPDSPKRGN
jgi:putative transposase